MSHDRIIISDLLARGIVGVNDWERREKQDIVANITLYADLRPAGERDDIDETVNYRTIAKEVIALIDASSRFTLEALAGDVTRLCLSNPSVRRVCVRLEKPGAVRFARSVGVEIERGHDDDG